MQNDGLKPDLTCVAQLHFVYMINIGSCGGNRCTGTLVYVYIANKTVVVVNLDF